MGIAAVVLFVAVSSLALTKIDVSVAGETNTLQTEESTLIIGGNEGGVANAFGGVLASPVFFSQHSSVSRDDFADSPSFAGRGGGVDIDVVSVQSSAIRAFASPVTNFASLNERDEITTYIVQEGDTVSSIAATFGISSGSIVWSNSLKNADYLRPGQKLVILPVSGVLYKVKSGDTLVAIIKKYGGDLEKTLAVNGLPLDGTILIGQEIVVVDGAPPRSYTPRYSAPRYATSTVSAGYFIYPTTGRNWGRIHANNGVDVANSCGTGIYAAASGTVILSDGVGWNGGFGKYIKIKHPNGVVTLYSHNSQNLVAAGTWVVQGQLIAYMGTTGRSTGCHLHFEVHGARNPLARY